MNKFDPNEVFINNFGRRLKKTSSKQDLHPAEIHCGIRDNCFCSKNSDCAVTQTCTTFPNSTFRVCQTIGETPINFDSFILLSPEMNITN